MTKRNEQFVIEFVILFGFLNGLWVYLGVNPETELLKAVIDLIPEMSSLLFWSISVLLTGIAIYAAYVIGRWAGLLAILAAFLGGVFIESWGIWSLLVGIGIGWFAPLSTTG